MALTDVKYEGLHTWNTGTVYGERDGVRVRFQFRDVVVGDGSVQLSLSNIKHWLYVPSEGSWQRNSEFSAENNAAMQVTKTRKSSVVLLNLDCSTSLGGDFSKLTKHAKSFIATLYNAAVDASDVTGVSLSALSKSLYVGDAATLQATVSPSSAANKTILWASSAPSVAKVSSSGTVTAVGVGSCVITATSLDGGLTASCNVTVKERPVPQAVDMGLSVKWASWNVGADAPEEYGDYFAWGETAPKATYDWSTYKYCKGSSSTLTKYCQQSSCGYNGYTDKKTVLDLEDDAARANWGGRWRMPTDAEWTELRDTYNCIWTWTKQNDTNGYKVSSIKTGNSIFLPAAGRRYDSSLYNAWFLGYYWSSSLNTVYPYSAFYVYFISSEVSRYGSHRIYGQSVRAVTE